MKTKTTPHDATERTAFLRELTTPPRGVTQCEAARLLRVNETTIRKWLAKPGAASRREPPWCAVELLRRMVDDLR